MKQKFLKVCDHRGDSVADGMHLPLNAAITDLHAADAQYHLDCYTTFASRRNITALGSLEGKEQEPSDIAFKQIVDTLQDNPAKIWNLVEINEIYCTFINSAKSSCSTIGGEIINKSNSSVTNDIEKNYNRYDRSLLIQRSEKHISDSLIALLINGCASIICFRKYLPETC